MEAHGVDALIAANVTHITVTWKTLRGRLTSFDGSNMDVIPISRIFDTHLIPATENQKGCFQLNLIGSETSIAFEENWMAAIRNGNLNHAVLFNQAAQFQFNSFAAYVKERITYLRKSTPLYGGSGSSATN